MGATYDIVASTGERKQLSMFFNGEGLARILFAKNGNSKVIIDYKKQEISEKDFNTGWTETKKIDPLEIPVLINSKEAAAGQAESLGTGSRKGFPYHRWGKKIKENEWEVWTDDMDCFPVYYRSIKNGEVSTWTLVNAWIDGSTYDKPTFFTLEPDPPPPLPEKTEEEKEEEKRQEKIMQEKKHHQSKYHDHKSAKKKNESSDG